MSMGRTTLLVLALSACGGSSVQVSDGSAALPSEPVAAPQADDATDLAALQAYADQIIGSISELTVEHAPTLEEGDLTRTTSGYRQGDTWVAFIDEQSVGEYGTKKATYVLRDGTLVAWSRSGHGFDDALPEFDFAYFDEQVLFGPDGAVLRSRRRSAGREFSGMEVDLSGVDWDEGFRPLEPIQLAPVLARMDQQPNPPSP